MANRNRKPCQVRKNNLKRSRPTKLSRQAKKLKNCKKGSVGPIISLETNLTEEIFDAQIIQNFLSGRYGPRRFDAAYERVVSMIDICRKFDKVGLLVNVVCVNIQSVICEEQKKNMKNIMIALAVR